MSQSRFLILVGRGNAFHGEGFHPDRMLAYFGDKGVWVLWDGKLVHRLITPGRFIIDDGLLMISLFILLPCVRDGDILTKEDIYKCVSVEEHNRINRQHIGNRRRIRSSITAEIRRDIDEKELLELYEKNKRFISTFYDLKLLCVLLSSITFRFGVDPVVASIYTGTNRVNSGAEPWESSVNELDAILKDEYGLRNYEICPSVKASFWGSFSDSRCEGKEG